LRVGWSEVLIGCEIRAAKGCSLLESALSCGEVKRWRRRAEGGFIYTQLTLSERHGLRFDAWQKIIKINNNKNTE
jgi:hypothetical protein